MSNTYPLIHIEINANSNAELRLALDTLSGHLDVTPATRGLSETDTTAVVEVEQAPETLPKKAKPKKAKAKAVAETETKVETQEPSKKVEDHASADAVEEGIKTLQSHMSANPADIPKIALLQGKYNVGMLSAIRPEQAHEFLADAKLVAAGVELQIPDDE